MTGPSLVEGFKLKISSIQAHNFLIALGMPCLTFSAESALLREISGIVRPSAERWPHCRSPLRISGFRNPASFLLLEFGVRILRVEC